MGRAALRRILATKKGRGKKMTNPNKLIVPGVGAPNEPQPKIPRKANESEFVSEGKTLCSILTESIEFHLLEYETLSRIRAMGQVWRDKGINTAAMSHLVDGRIFKGLTDREKDIAFGPFRGAVLPEENNSE